MAGPTARYKVLVMNTNQTPDKRARRCTRTLGHGGPHDHDPRQVRGFLHGSDCGEPVARNRRDREREWELDEAIPYDL